MKRTHSGDPTHVCPNKQPDDSLATMTVSPHQSPSLDPIPHQAPAPIALHPAYKDTSDPSSSADTLARKAPKAAALSQEVVTVAETPSTLKILGHN